MNKNDFLKYDEIIKINNNEIIKTENSNRIN